MITKSTESFKVLTECPLIVMLLFQLYPRYIQTTIPVPTAAEAALRVRDVSETRARGVSIGDGLRQGERQVQDTSATCPRHVPRRSSR